MDGTSRLFIGRDAEMAELSAGLRDAIGGRGGLFLIAGEPGIGKTMLAEQLAALAEAQGALTLMVREGREPLRFEGWLELLHAIAVALGERGGPAQPVGDQSEGV